MAAAQDFASKQPQIHFIGVSDLAKSSSTAPTETFSLENVPLRPRSASHHLSSTKVPSRLWLKVQARFWRYLMSLGMNFHDFAPPTPPKVSFVRKIPTSPPTSGPIELYFYTPPNYHELRQSNHRFPVVINFHGGGFCLGHATDDRYWARVVVEKTSAVFVSVNYRLAPEHPFPIPVDDCVDALLYLSGHADELGLDTNRTALTGFSAGANLAFTVPLRLTYHTLRSRVDLSTTPSSESDGTSSQNLLSKAQESLPTPLKITAIVAWYPLLDWTMSRAQKKRNSCNPRKTLPKTFTDLFDFSYLPPPDAVGNHCSPYASPSLAPDRMLVEGLPSNIQIWLCEWDMLLREGEDFSSRLQALGKNVESQVIPGVAHGWDKHPNPYRDQSKIDALYERAAAGLKEAFV